MILENKQEKDAFDFVMNLASEQTERICNDLSKEIVEKFKGLTVDTDDGGKIVEREIVFDSDIIQWLEKQVKK